jgi:nucleoid DNA-binding protein
VDTYKAAQSDPEHSVFLKNFGTFKVASLSQSEVTADQAVLEMLIDMQREIARIRRQTDTTKSRGFSIDATALRKLIFELINEFKHNNPGCTLKDNDELEKFVGTQLPHFRASQDLKNALEQVINEMELLDKL